MRDERERENSDKDGSDYVVGRYHSDRSITAVSNISEGFTVVKTYQMTLSSGIKNIKIFKGAV
jgi:hypothetical protein